MKFRKIELPPQRRRPPMPDHSGNAGRSGVYSLTDAALVTKALKSPGAIYVGENCLQVQPIRRSTNVSCMNKGVAQMRPLLIPKRGKFAAPFLTIAWCCRPLGAQSLVDSLLAAISL